MRLAWPMAGWGISPSPAISFEVSMMTTRFLVLSASTRAASRSMVVLPTPGRPSSRMFCPDSMRSAIMSTMPKTARPTLQVRPTMSPWRLRIAEMRWRVRSMPALLSVVNSPMRATTKAMSFWSTSLQLTTISLWGKRASGGEPRSSTISRSSFSPDCSRRGSRMCGGSTSRRASRSSATTCRTTSYQPLVARSPCCGIVPISRPGIASPRPRETFAMISGSR